LCYRSIYERHSGKIVIIICKLVCERVYTWWNYLPETVPTFVFNNMIFFMSRDHAHCSGGNRRNRIFCTLFSSFKYQ